MIACNGRLVAWRLMVQSETIDGLHLGVFRRSTGKKTDFFALINQTRVQLDVKVASKKWGFDARRTWVTIKVPTPYRVRQGDYIGIWYDARVKDKGDPVIGTREPYYTAGDLLKEADYAAYQWFDFDTENLNPRVPVPVNGSSHVSQLIPGLVALVTRAPRNQTASGSVVYVTPNVTTSAPVKRRRIITNAANFPQPVLVFSLAPVFLLPFLLK